MTLAMARKQWKESDKRIIKNVRMLLSWSGLTQDALAEHLGITGKTLRERIKAPETFRQSEIRTLKFLANIYEIEWKET